MLTVELIRRGARQFADDAAVVCGEERLTFAEVDALSNQLANALIDRARLKAGARVGLLLNNSLFSVPIDFACAKARLARVPLNARLTAAEHGQMLQNAGVGVLVHGPDLSQRARELAGLVPGLAVFGLGVAALGPDLLQLARGASSAPPPRRAEPGDVVLTIYTSGTTGALKAAEHTQASYAAIALNILLNLIEPRRGEAMLHAASLIHASGTFVLPYWLRGGRSLVLPGFQPTAYLDAIERLRPTALNLVPTMLGMLLDQKGIERRDLSSVETIVYGASPMPRPIIERALDLWGPRFVQYYGQTEAPLAITASPRPTTSAKGRTNGGSLAGVRASTAKCGWSTPRAKTSKTASPARSPSARLSRWPDISAPTRSTRRCSSPTGGCAPATSDASTRRAISISSTERRT